jgi:hypothetical protein
MPCSGVKRPPMRELVVIGHLKHGRGNRVGVSEAPGLRSTSRVALPEMLMHLHVIL